MYKVILNGFVKVFIYQLMHNRVVYFLVGDSSASEFYMPTFRNTLFHLHRQVGRGEFRPRQTRQLPRAVDLKGRLLSCQSY